MTQAEYNEIEDTGEELDFAEADSLPWLEAEEVAADAGGPDTAQMVGFFALLAVILLAVVGAVYFVSNYNRGPVPVADGSLIEAPEGPYKQRPEEAGGKEFAGTGDVAPEVGQGQTPEARMADATGAKTTGAGAGDQDLNLAMPPIGPGGSKIEPQAAVAASEQSARAPDAPSPATASSAKAASGVGVQVGAYSSRARAQQGWQMLQRQSPTLARFERRILEGQADRGPVFRLQAVAPTLDEANRLCRTLRGEGLDCQVKP